MQKLPVSEKLGYASGQFAGTFVWQVVIIFLAKFYTDTFGISAAAVGTLFLVVRIFDAVNDPMMGVIADRTNTRWGKFRPYLLWMAVPYAVLGVLAFITPNFSPAGKLAYAYVTYASMMVVYTAITIPLLAMAGVMTSDHVERTSLNSYGFVGAFSALLIIQALTVYLVRVLGKGDDRLGYPLTMAVYGVLAIVFFLFMFFMSHERVHPPPKQKTSIARDLNDLLHNVPWIMLFLLSLAILVYVNIRSGNILYYFDYYFQQERLSFTFLGRQYNPDAASAFMVVGTAMILCTVPLAKVLTQIFGKRNAFIGCNLGVAATLFLQFFVHPGQVKLLFGLQIAYSLFTGPTMPLIWSMYADSADYSEWRTGRRATGLVFSASTFAYKFGGAVGGAILMWIFAFCGYEANVEQGPQALMGIRLCMSIIPAAIALLMVVLLCFYKLDKKTLNQIQEDLEQRRRTESASPAAD